MVQLQSILGWVGFFAVWKGVIVGIESVLDELILL